MVNISVNKRLLKQLKEYNELHRCENTSKIKIKVSKEVYDKAEKMAKELNTDVEGVLAFAACAFMEVPHDCYVDDGY